MKLEDVFSRSGRRMLIRPPGSEQDAEQGTKPVPLTREQVAEALAKRGIRMRNAPPSSLVRRS